MADDQDITAPYESEALQAGWAAKSMANARPRCYASILFGAKTDLGRTRENNEDKFDFMEPDEPSVLATKGRVFAVADGMGGHSAGQIAAELALNVFIRSYYSNGDADVEASLRGAAEEANTFVVDVANTVPGRKGMGATLTAAVVRDDDMYLCQVGDSRCYLLRGGKLEQLTEDHSWVAEQVRSGALTLEQAEQSPFRNVITRSMGGEPSVEPDVTAIRVLPGDRFLLCSDGLSGMVSDAEIQDVLGQGSPSIVVWNLIERANAGGGKDNITAFVLHVAEIIPWPEDEAEGAAGAEANGRAHGDGAKDEARSAGKSAAPAEGQGSRGGLMGRLFRSR
jgi:PPM family protein phosphatase